MLSLWDFESLTGNANETPETALARKENAMRLREAVQLLAPEYRLILVDFIKLRRSHGMPLEETMVAAGAMRFRPMLLTAL